MADTVRYGLIGTGMMGLEHVRNLALVPGAQLVAAADPDEGSRKWATLTGGREVALFDDYRRMLREVRLDAAIVATPNFTHVSVLDDLLPTGMHILCEKPLCTTLDDCRRIVDAVARRSGVFWTGMEYRYSPPVTRFVSEVHGGTAGNVKMLAIREHRYPFLKKVDDWNRFNRNTGGTLVEKSCHHFDLMRHLLRSEPARVFASGGMDVNHLDESYDGETPDILDNALVIVDFADGARALLDLCMFAEGSRNQTELAATGDAGKVECLMPAGDIITGRRAPRSIDTEHVSVDESVEKAGFHHGATYFELMAFQRAIVDGGVVEVTAMDGLRAVAMGIAAQRSIDEGRPVQMSEFGL
jgi:myo-inositol 2-dehydrogenase/D-chiro-inositol 1-dehydrogenase